MQPRLNPPAAPRVLVAGVAVMAALALAVVTSSGLERVAETAAHVANSATSKSGKTAGKTAGQRRPPPPAAPELLDPAPVRPGFGKPVIIATTDLLEFGQLSAGRQRLVATAIALAQNSPWLPYVFGGADPALGGLDCSGAMYYVMTRLGLAPPRTSAGQYAWVRDHLRLHLIPDDASTTEHLSLAWLLPGDLLFWSTPAAGSAPPLVNITHVAMYLGREKKDGRQVMINATDGRSYRGTQANGYGVYDFRMPRAGATSKMVGYGLPPGIPEVIAPVASPTHPPSRRDRPPGRETPHSL